MAAFDHIAVAARSLAEGAEWLRDRLGVALQPGGRRTAMGTHNMLLSLGPDLPLNDPRIAVTTGLAGIGARILTPSGEVPL